MIESVPCVLHYRRVAKLSTCLKIGCHVPPCCEGCTWICMHLQYRWSCFRDVVAVQVQNARISLQIELRPTWASDQVLQQAARLPAACQVTLLHLPSICHDVTLEGLRCALSFSQLVSLKMHLYGPCITDGVFAALQNLSNLRELCFGVLAHVCTLLRSPPPNPPQPTPENPSSLNLMVADEEVFLSFFVCVWL